jgi:peptide/nickel transport system ATP-binding protein
MTPLLEVEKVSRTFRTGSHRVVALDGVSITVQEGESLGIVGESGSGKTTLGRIILRLESPDSGSVRFDGCDVLSLRGRSLLAYRRRVQIVFQNSAVAFNPHRKVLDLLTDGYAIHDLVPRRERSARAAEALDRVGLSPAHLSRYPHQLSSGQRQRLGIARALSVEPQLLVADEPVSALDVSIQAQVLNLVAELREERNLALLMIGHDLRPIYFLCERIAVMYLGRIVEVGPREAVLEDPVHPYTQALIRSVPSFRPGSGFTRDALRGEAKERATSMHGCPFAPRCSLRAALSNPPECVEHAPELRLAAGREVACHFATETDVAASSPRSVTAR